MRIISHRGNLNGPRSSENSMKSVNEALEKGFDVEVDIWRENDSMWLGHDFPLYFVSDLSFLDDKRVWFHAKNLEALHYMCKNHPNSNFFWHQKDDFTLTSSGKIWTYPDKHLCSESIIVAMDLDQIDFAMKYPIYGICTDDPEYVANNLLEKPVIENRYREYIEGCMIENISPVDFFEFKKEVEAGKCEVCLVFDEPACDCSKQDI